MKGMLQLYRIQKLTAFPALHYHFNQILHYSVYKIKIIWKFFTTLYTFNMIRVIW